MNFRLRLGNRKFSPRHARVFRLSPSLPFAALTLTTANKSLLPSSPSLPAGPASALSLLLSSPSSAQGQCRVLSEGLKELARCAVEPRFSCFFLSLVHCRRGRRQQATSRTTNKASNFFCFSRTTTRPARSGLAPATPTPYAGSGCPMRDRHQERGGNRGDERTAKRLVLSVVAAARSFCSPSCLLFSLSLARILVEKSTGSLVSSLSHDRTEPHSLSVAPLARVRARHS